MTLADDPHLIERIARMVAFHDLPTPVVVQVTLMVSELLRRPANLVHEEAERRIAQLRTASQRDPPALRVISSRTSANRRSPARQ